MLLRILLCAVLTVLLLLLGCLVSAALLLPVKGKEVYMLLTGVGDGGSLEQSCRAYLFLKGLGLLRRPLLLVDAGLSEQGRRLASRLATLDTGIVLCSMEEMTKLIHNGV